MKKTKKGVLADILPIILFIISAINLFMSAFTGVFSLIIASIIGLWAVFNIKKKDILYFISLGISILAILIFVFINILGIFNVSNQLNETKKQEFADTASQVLANVKDDYIYHKYDKTKCYMLKDINKLKHNNIKLKYSPIKSKYSTTSFVKVYKDENGVVSASICLIDENNNGFNYVDQEHINKSSLIVGAADLCVIPSDCE